jgi:hypothetical protein
MNFLQYVREIRGDKAERKFQGRRNAGRIRALREWIQPCGVGAEMGVHKGHFSRLLVDQLRPQKLYLIDSWWLTEGKEWGWGEGNRNVIDGLHNAMKTIENELVAGTVEVIIQSDLVALQSFPSNSLDWAYIDTSHRYDHTAAELEALKRVIKPNGIISGDDWREDPAHPHHGVCRAVREFVEREGYVLSTYGPAAQWAIKR